VLRLKGIELRSSRAVMDAALLCSCASVGFAWCARALRARARELCCAWKRRRAWRLCTRAEAGRAGGREGRRERAADGGKALQGPSSLPMEGLWSEGGKRAKGELAG
jgi:hypothetical protein